MNIRACKHSYKATVLSKTVETLFWSMLLVEVSSASWCSREVLKKLIVGSMAGVTSVSLVSVPLNVYQGLNVLHNTHFLMPLACMFGYKWLIRNQSSHDPKNVSCFILMAYGIAVAGKLGGVNIFPDRQLTRFSVFYDVCCLASALSLGIVYGALKK